VITIVCKTCGTAVRIMGIQEEVSHLFGEQSEWYPDKYPCPRVGCNGRSEIVNSIESSALLTLDMHELTPQEAFAAFHGLGFPEEKDCGAEAIKQVFAQSSVKTVQTYTIRGTQRAIVQWIELENGIRLYLAGSAWGAMVYRISKPHSYTKKELDAQ
jgi:hypothetical protein